MTTNIPVVRDTKNPNDGNLLPSNATTTTQEETKKTDDDHHDDDDNDVIYLPEVIKGKSDWRSYRPILLPNGMTCLLVHDIQSKTTAMSVCVGVGASADPRQLSGLAHFTEHMCFLGSVAYPGENEYKRYLSCHGGRSNASTSMSCTTYKFDVIAEHAQQAVDIFANFFVQPLFTENGTSREVNAVDSENSKNLVVDGRRRLQILKDIADPTHHYSKFSTGNAITIPAAVPAAASDDADIGGGGIKPTTNDESDNDTGEAKTKEGEEEPNKITFSNAEQVRDAMLSFHKRHYRPDNMTVVIVGPQSLDTLQEWIVPRFASIENRWTYAQDDDGEETMTDLDRLIDEAARDLPPDSYDEPLPPYNPAFRPELLQQQPGGEGGKWPVLLTTLPLKAVRKLVLLFPVPSVLKVPDRSPVRLISHLLGHEGPGSSFAILQDEGLLSSLSVGSRVYAADQCVLQVDIALTEKGEEQWKDVITTIFQHCRLLHRTVSAAVDEEADGNSTTPNLDTLKRIWDEMATMQRMDFHNTSPGGAYSFAPSVAQGMRYYGVTNCVSAGSMLDDVEGDTLPSAGETLVDFTSRLVPSNCIVERCSQNAWDEMVVKKGLAADDDEGKDGNRSTTFGLRKEKWYGIDYHLSPISNDDVNKWECDTNGESLIHLPTPNRYIPRTLELCPDLPNEAKLGPRIEKEIDPPKLIIQNDVGRLWHRLDDRYALPKSSLSLLMRTPAVQHSFDDVTGKWVYDTDVSINSLLLVGSFSDAMAQQTYDADLAGLYWSLSKSPSGLTLRCSGYSERLADLATMLLQTLLLPPSGGSSGEDGKAPESPAFLEEKYFTSAKDRVVRSLRSYLVSSRADSLAMYYTNLLLASDGLGVEQSLRSAEGATLEMVREHLQQLVVNGDIQFECLYTGNVSSNEACNFFASASDIVAEAKHIATNDGVEKMPEQISKWIAGPCERQLTGGKDVELHFQSTNKEEDNGAVLMTFQSGLGGYKGEKLSTPESLRESAAIRLLCHMLREPLFDELRTKQQLGYVVSSYFDVNFSTEPDGASTPTHATTPVNSIVVNILSKKVSPPEVALRVDEFLDEFRETLTTMPQSEIESHTEALSKKLLKPIQKLGDEASIHFQKIHRFGPEVIDGRKLGSDAVPWFSVKAVAQAIASLERKDLLGVWDSVVAGKRRSRIVSHVYGRTFPLSNEPRGSMASLGLNKRHRSSVSTLDTLFNVRQTLGTVGDHRSRGVKEMWDKLTASRRGRLGLAAVAALGIGAVGFGLYSRCLGVGGSTPTSTKDGSSTTTRSAGSGSRYK